MLKVEKRQLKWTVWLSKLKYGYVGIITLVAIEIITNPITADAAGIEASSLVAQQQSYLEEQIRTVCLWLGSLLFLVAVPGAFFGYLHDANVKNRRVGWLPVLSGVVVIGVSLVFLASPIAQLFSSTFGIDMLGRK
jgi:hypothetical protein